ncbi:MAG: large conductance mechanosensitive channel protein MscL [Actinomycetaceae bacterium]|nr:large conductance mechanosensitive channel protein MscL [Actinomycetaceae bacterium]MDU0970939.1 large conductance mechanosensitive channel protein MscL [Actinomycetaceae bacterium]
MADEKQGVFAGFKAFIARGNAMEMAVGIVIGGAFTAVVTAIVEKFINPLIAGLVGKPNFDNVLEFHVRSATVQPGAIITALVNFLLIAAAVYFLIVLPMNKLNAAAVARAKKEKDEADAAPAPVDPNVALLTEIRDLLAAQPQRPGAAE